MSLTIGQEKMLRMRQRERKVGELYSSVENHVTNLKNIKNGFLQLDRSEIQALRRKIAEAIVTFVYGIAAKEGKGIKIPNEDDLQDKISGPIYALTSEKADDIMWFINSCNDIIHHSFIPTTGKFDFGNIMENLNYRSSQYKRMVQERKKIDIKKLAEEIVNKAINHILYINEYVDLTQNIKPYKEQLENYIYDLAFSELSKSQERIDEYYYENIVDKMSSETTRLVEYIYDTMKEIQNYDREIQKYEPRKEGQLEMPQVRQVDGMSIEDISKLNLPSLDEESLEKSENERKFR